VFSSPEGYRLTPSRIYESSINISSYQKPISTLTLKDNEAILSVYSHTLIENVSGNITFKNASILNNPEPIIPYNSFNCHWNSSYIKFFIIPKEEKSGFDLLKIPINLSNNPNITMYIYINGNLSLSKIFYNINKINVTNYSGLTFYTDNLADEINLTYGHEKEILLLANNIKENITNISGYIYINRSILNVYNYGIPESSVIYYKHKLKHYNISLTDNYLYFNISFNSTNGTFGILRFYIYPKINKNISTLIYIKNLSVYKNFSKPVILPYKNLTINIIERPIKLNHPPKLKIACYIYNNKEVHFLALAYDSDNDSLKYFWDFGDNSTSTIKDPIHVYKNFSYYLVKCIVKDSLNASAKVEGILEIKNYTPVLKYCLSNITNNTIYLNISLINPFKTKILGYISVYNKNYNFYLKPNETLNLSIPINISDDVIKYNIIYYPIIKNKKNEKFEILYYTWNYERKLTSNISESTKILSYNINKTLNLNSSKIIIKINKNYLVKNYNITKSVKTFSKKSLFVYIFTTIFSFILGFILVYSNK
ncbi:PKD domain-containing protein, partial [Methanocaldococcus villosus KIN24-T80]